MTESGYPPKGGGRGNTRRREPEGTQAHYKGGAMDHGELRDLYQEIILDHNKHPRNFHKLTKSTHHADGFNPLCGDEIHLYLEMEGDVIKDIGFEGSGCAISKASSSLMTSS